MPNRQLRSLIRRYVRAVLEAHDARVPNQLVNDEVKDDEDADETDEASGAGAVAGFTLPLGMGTGKKRKKPGWK